MEYEFRGKGRPQKYPWEKWLDGRTRRLYRHKHFSVSTAALIRAAKYAAERSGLTLRANRQSETCVVIQAAKAKK
jgi:hypothetical protein